MFKKGDKVYSVDYGWGEVVDVVDFSDYPVEVLFCDGDKGECYSQEGRYFIDENRSLFFAEIPIPPGALVRPANYKKGNTIMVNVGDPENVLNWAIRVFAGFDEEGHPLCESVFHSSNTCRIGTHAHMSLSEFDEKFNQ